MSISKKRSSSNVTPKKPSPLRRARKVGVAKKFTLPSVSSFLNLPIKARAVVFGNWLKGKPRKETYDYMDDTKCALGQFAQELYKDKEACGVNSTIGAGNQSAFSVEVFPAARNSAHGPLVCAIWRGKTTSKGHKNDGDKNAAVSFGAASDAYQKGLKSKWFKQWKEEALG